MIRSSTEATAFDWLQPEADASWAWTRRVEVVTWSDGTTLLFREELAQILGRLPAIQDTFKCRSHLSSPRGREGQAFPRIPTRTYRTLCTASTNWRSLPQDLLSGIPAKTHLVEYFNAGLPCLSAAWGEEVIRILREGSAYSSALAGWTGNQAADRIVAPNRACCCAR